PTLQAIPHLAPPRQWVVIEIEPFMGRALLAAQLGQERDAVKDRARGPRRTGHLQHRGQEIAAIDHVVTDAALWGCAEPVGDERHMRTGFCRVALAAAHLMAVDQRSNLARGAIVAQEKDER